MQIRYQIPGYEEITTDPRPEIRSEIHSFLEKNKTENSSEAFSITVTINNQSQIYYIHKDKVNDFLFIISEEKKVIDLVSNIRDQFKNLNQGNIPETLKKTASLLESFKTNNTEKPYAFENIFLNQANFSDIIDRTTRNKLLSLKEKKLQNYLALLSSTIQTVSSVTYHYSTRFQVETDFKSKQENLLNQLEQLRNDIKTELNKTSEARKENYKSSLVIRTFSDKKERNLFGTNSSGHTTAEIVSENDSIYLGCYPLLRQGGQSIPGKVMNKVGMPDLFASREGYFVDLEYDLNLVGEGEGKKYSSYDEVLIPLNENQLKKVSDWATHLVNKDEQIKVKNRRFPKVKEFNFVTKNCAWYAAEALNQTGIEHGYQGATLFHINTPHTIREHAYQLAKELIQADEKAVQYSIGMDEIERFERYINYAIKRLSLLTKNTSDGKSEEDKDTMEVKDIIEELQDIYQNKIQDLLQRKETIKKCLQEKLSKLPSQKMDSHIEYEVSTTLYHLANLTNADLPVEVELVSQQIELFWKETKAKCSQGQFTEERINIQKKIEDEVIRPLENPATIEDLYFKIRKSILILKQYVHDNHRKSNFSPLFDSFCHKTLSALKQAQFTLNKKLYFDFKAEAKPEGLQSTANPILENLKLVFNTKDTSIETILKNVKSPEHFSTFIEENTLKKNLTLNSYYKFEPEKKPKKTPPIPHVLNLLERKTRHLHFECSTKGKIYRVVNDNKAPLFVKLREIDRLTNKYKPSQFWRKSEKKRYEEMAAEAKLICLVDGFYQCQLSEMQLVAELDKLLPHLPPGMIANVEGFKQNLIDIYNGYTRSKVGETSSYGMLLSTIKETTKKDLVDLYGKKFEAKFEQGVKECLEQIPTKPAENQSNIDSYAPLGPQEEQALWRSIISPR